MAGGKRTKFSKRILNKNELRRLQRKRKLPTTKHPYPVCGAQCVYKAVGTYCQSPAGFQTDHFGEGRCFRHGGKTPCKSGRYSIVSRPTLRKWMGKLEKLDDDPMDLIPELQFLRAIVMDFIERYDEFTEALLGWYASFKKNFQLAGRPKQVLDIADVSRIVGQIAYVVTRIQQMRQNGAITMKTFARVTEAMGVEVARHVKDGELLQAIEDGWNSIRIDPITGMVQIAKPKPEETEDQQPDLKRMEPEGKIS